MKLPRWLVGLAAAAVPGLASAHVKWFTEGGVEARPYRLADGPAVAWLAVGAALVAVGVWLERRLAVPAWLQARLSSWGPKALSVVTIGGGAALAIFSMNGFVFAPNLPATGGVGVVLLALQAAAGLMLMLGMYARLAGKLLVALYLLAVWEYGAVEMLDALEMLGLGLFAVLAGRPAWGVTPAANRAGTGAELALPTLRVLTGANLAVLGFTEKILAPGLAGEFLGKHDWNFMRAVGLTDYWFAFSAGATEALFGLFLVLGLVTRLTTLLLAAFLAMTLALLGPVELMGHLPHFSIAVALLVLGSGDRLKVG